MKHKGYEGKVEFDEDSEVFHGEVLGVRDVLTFQATTVKDLRKAFVDTVEDYLSFCAERGEEPDKPFTGSFLVRLSPEQHRHCWVQARKQGKSLNAWVAEQLAQDR